MTIEHRAGQKARFGALILPWLACPFAALAETAPMSAIDWLSGSIATPVAVAPPATRGSRANVPPVPGEPPVSRGLTDEVVSVGPIGQSSANGLGLVPPEAIGLPRDLWGRTPEDRLARLLRKERIDTLPSMQAFLMELLLAEFAPPEAAAPDSRNMLFLARIDRLLDMGALDQAMALLEQTESSDPEIFRRRFDVALLLGQEDKACEIMVDTPSVAPSFPARIFCLARHGDWQAAALSLDTGRALGQIDPEMSELLLRFLDAELAEVSDPLPPPTRPTPLVFRLLEAIGEPLSTGPLPLAFAQADLQSNAGWKAQIEAAERLTRAGVLDPNQLLGLYTQERASASGGVWDRVTVVSSLDRALTAGDATRVSQILPGAWEAMQGQELEPALAAMFAPRLADLQLTGTADDLGLRLGLLTPDFAEAAARHTVHDQDEALLVAIARGDTGAASAQDQLGLMLKRVFDAPVTAAPATYQPLLMDRRGEAMLNAIDDITEGARGDYRRVEAGLKLLRYQGLETVARRTALEMIVLERNG
ncbi:hypothetical protein [Paenirhodobacter populi]|uniref:Tetratricopeptide repeat protein n=1 Tax=Paenirhodobacter populi TaxID=2306993 RepID=A0A443J331_9RHOB|nr:hypothetical protein [Sinirhodobacter populi]RWR14736.1 hypothetical protein D2T33_01915 [Sinirhodobacter populi]